MTRRLMQLNNIKLELRFQSDNVNVALYMRRCNGHKSVVLRYCIFSILWSFIIKRSLSVFFCSLPLYLRNLCFFPFFYIGFNGHSSLANTSLKKRGCACMRVRVYSDVLLGSIGLSVISDL